MSWLKTIKQGSAYMNLWPDEPVLMAVFPETRAKAMLNVAQMVIPPGVAFILFWIYYICGGLQGLIRLFTHPSAASMYLYLAVSSLIIVALVLIVVPIHAYFWFGVRASTPLNPKQNKFYCELCQKIEVNPKQNPTMLDLITAINAGLKVLKDKEFLEKL